MMIVFVASVTIYSAALLAMVPIGIDRVLCRSNAVGMSARDGFTICTIQAMCLVYLIQVRSMSAFLQSLILFRSIVLRIEENSKYWKYQLIFVHVLPLVLVVLVYVNGLYGYAERSGVLTTYFLADNEQIEKVNIQYGFLMFAGQVFFGILTTIFIHPVLIRLSMNSPRGFSDDSRRNHASSMMVEVDEARFPIHQNMC
jgi:hypothetical protein